MFLVIYIVGVYLVYYIAERSDPAEDSTNLILSICWPIVIPLIIVIGSILIPFSWVSNLAKKHRGKS